MSRVVVIGYLSIDCVQAADGTARAQAGGAALYAARGARAAGAAVRLFAAAGTDWPAAWSAALARAGIDVAGIAPRPVPSRRARISHAADGTRASPHHADPAWWQATTALLPPLPATLAQGEVMVLAPMPAAHAALALGRAGQASAIADTSEAFALREADAIRALLPRLAAFAPSREESRLLGPLAGCPVVEKRGAEGLALREGAREDDPWELFAPPPTQAIDPTGAGDAAVGAIAGVLAAGLGLRAAVAAAVAIGARAVGGHGASALGFAA